MSRNWKLKNEEGIGYWYENDNGEKSETFSQAWSYSDGFGLVKLNNGKYAYRDVDGNISEEYKYAFKYYNDFAPVELNNGMCGYRYIDGSIISCIEYKSLERFFSGEENVYHLRKDVFGNKQLLAWVIKRVKDDACRFIKLAKTKKQLKAVKEYYLETMEYILSTAHDIWKDKKKQSGVKKSRIKKNRMGLAGQEKKNDKKVKKFFASRQELQQEMLDELNLNK